jgi:hypothetical protein
MNRKTENRTVVIIVIIVIFIVQFFPILTIGQNKYLLSKGNMNEFKLISQRNIFWQINLNSHTRDAIEQRWKINEEDYFIDYCMFPNDPAAINSTSFNANSNATPFVFGSTTGEILGDFSWVSIDGSALYFQCDSFGVKVYKPNGINSEAKNELFNISKLILNRIKENDLSKVGLDKKQILGKGNLIIAGRIDSLFSSVGFIHNKSERSKWIINNDSVIYSIRDQWRKHNSIFSIDVIELSDTISIQAALSFRSKISFCPVITINNDSIVSAELEKCYKNLDILTTPNDFSFIVKKDNLLLHFYYHNNGEIDHGFIYNITQCIKKD